MRGSRSTGHTSFGVVGQRLMNFSACVQIQARRKATSHLVPPLFVSRFRVISPTSELPITRRGASLLHTDSRASMRHRPSTDCFTMRLSRGRLTGLVHPNPKSWTPISAATEQRKNKQDKVHIGDLPGCCFGCSAEASKCNTRASTNGPSASISRTHRALRVVNCRRPGTRQGNQPAKQESVLDWTDQ
jgi:hypothetical protein